MSLNLLRTKMKKKRGHEKKNSGDSTTLKGSPASVVGIGATSGVYGGPLRKSLSTSTPPDISSPVHQSRKISLSTDSPIHSTSLRPTPTSPLVNAKSLGLLPPSSRESTSSIFSTYSGSSSVGSGSGMSTPVFPVPKVSVANDDQPLGRQGIIDITVNVHSFLAAISKLKKAMEDSDGRSRDEQDSEAPMQSPGAPGGAGASSDIVSHLTNLIQVVQTCLGEHTGMQSTEIKDAAKHLMNTYQTCDHAFPSTCTTCNESIDALIDAFTNSVSEYLTGESAETDSSYGASAKDSHSSKKSLERANMKGFSKSHDNLSSKFNSYVNLSQQFSEPSTRLQPVNDEIDQALNSIDNSIDVATRYIKMRMKYHKEIVSYLTKRAHIESSYFKQMNSLGTKTSKILQDMAEEHALPLIDVFRESVEHDMRFACNCNKTYNQQVGSRLMEPFEQKMNDTEKTRKELTNTWRSERKKLNESKTAMKSAESKYRFLGGDLARVKNLLAGDPYGKQADKRKKEVTDLESKWQEAESAYKAAIALCNDCQYQVHVAAQKSILCAYRRMAVDFDIQLQSGLETYFSLQHSFFKALPEPMAHFMLSVGKYSIGSEFMDYIQRQPARREEPEDYLFEEFDPEAEDDEELLMSEPSRFPTSNSSDSTFLNPGADEGTDRAPSPSSFPEHSPLIFTHSNPSVLVESRHHQNPFVTQSPRAHKKKRPLSEVVEGNQLDSSKTILTRRNSDHLKDNLSPPTGTSLHQQPIAQGVIPRSKMALTHTLKKLRGPARCRECDTYVYFHGYECEICGLACHKKCLETLAIRCGTKRLARKMNTFGVDFHKHLKATKRYIPIIVTKCIEEIDERALDTQGLYRISSAKTKLEHLCQLFESGADRVDLSDRPSHLIGSCLKLYFRQLPEPLLTFELYHDFVTFARECSYILPCNLDAVTEEKKQTALEMLERLKGLLQKLPYENYITLAKLLYHLKKVSHPDHVKHNFMPPSNLGIVFGPNLLRQREQVASLALLADMTAQAKAIEIMISHVNQLYHDTEEDINKVEEYDDDSEFTKEVNVDKPTESIKSPAHLDLDDVITAGSRTPYNTPPEQRRGNIFELGEVLEVLQSVGRRNSDELLKPPHPSLVDFRDHHYSTSLPSFSSFPNSVGTDDSTINKLGHYLRSPTTNPLEKMLTPVEERPAAEFDSPFSDDDDDEIGQDSSIIQSSSHKIDGVSCSRSTSGLSNPGVSWHVDSEVSSPKDCVSILSKDSVSILSCCENDRQGERDEESLNILETADGHKISSQSSDDSALFSESTRPVLGGRGGREDQGMGNSETVSSPTTRDASKQHQAFANSSSSRQAFSQKQNLVQEHSSRSQHSSPLSSTSRASQSSYSEATGDEGEPTAKTKRFSVVGKYEKYERCSLLNLISLDNSAGGGEVEGGVLSDMMNNSQGSTQDSSGTLTDEQGETSLTMEPLEGRGDDPVTIKLGGVVSGEIKKLNDLKDSLKHCDSGIDETPEANKSFQDGIRRSSMPPSEEDISLTDAKPLSSTTAFTSRESGLADSPDPELLAEEVLSHKQRTHAQKDTHHRPDKEEKDEAIKSSEVEIFVPLDGENVTELSDEEKQEQPMSLDDSFFLPSCLSFDRGSYARMPIRDRYSKTDLPLPDGGGLKFRSRSMDKIPLAFMEDSGEIRICGENRSMERRHFGLPTSRSTSFSPSHRSMRPQVNSHPNQMFSVTPSQSSLSPTSFKSDSLQDSAASSPSSSPSGSFRSAKNAKDNKGLKQIMKPALRVFKITPSTTVSPSPLAEPPQEAEEDEEEVSDDPTPMPSVESSPKVVEMRRVRMMSPEAVATHLSLDDKTLRRSQSSENILDSSPPPCDCNTTKIGSLVLITEPKLKTRAKLFSKIKKKKTSRIDSPILSAKSNHSASSLEGGSGTAGGQKSPKGRKRNRTPHFV